MKQNASYTRFAITSKHYNMIKSIISHNIGPFKLHKKTLMELYEEKCIRNSLFVGSHASTNGAMVWTKVFF